MKERGKFIVFEGLNGSGKGTQMGRFHNYMQSLGKAVPIFSTGEPTELNEWGTKARNMLKSDGDPYANELSALEYFAKGRIEHNEVFGPMLNLGINVISDRYYYSNFAYQHVQGIPYEKIAKENQGIILPDLTFILNTTAEESLARLNKDGSRGEKRKFDEHLSFNRNAFENYMELGLIVPRLMGDRSVCYIDAMSSPDKTFEEIKKIYHSRFS